MSTIPLPQRDALQAELRQLFPDLYEPEVLKGLMEEGTLIELKDIGNYPKDKVVIVSTGSQGEPMAALSRIANREHPVVEVGSSKSSNARSSSPDKTPGLRGPRSRSGAVSTNASSPRPARR